MSHKGGIDASESARIASSCAAFAAMHLRSDPRAAAGLQPLDVADQVPAAVTLRSNERYIVGFDARNWSKPRPGIGRFGAWRLDPVKRLPGFAVCASSAPRRRRRRARPWFR
jgi:hypothetical protein